MNDRFAAEIRKHLLETANERPAEGQLAAVIDGVETTRQQHPLIARLSVRPERFGPIPSTAIRYGLIAAALVGAALAGALVGAGSGPSGRTVFEGTWTSTDPADGSGMFLIVASGETPRVYFEDAYASGEACVDDVVKRFTADGIGTVVDDRLDVEWPTGGGCGLMTVGMDDGHFDYVRATDTLIDGQDLAWSRMDRSEAAPTPQLATDPPAQEPATEPTTQQPAAEPTAPIVSPPAPTPEGTDAGASPCVDLAQGGTYTATAGELSLTATIPVDPSIAWQGWPQAFMLSSECGSEGPISFVASTATTVTTTSCMPDITVSASFADAVARLDTPSGDDIAERVDLVIGGHPAVRYDIVDLRSCPDGFGLWEGTTLGVGETGSLYVIDVDGRLVAIESQRDGTETPAELDEANEIVASLRFE